MTLRPGVQVQVLTTPPPRSSPTDTGTWFVTGTSDQGRSDAPILVQSMSDFTRLLGPRASYSVLYDALDVFFREGGSSAWVGRVVGPTPVLASRNLVDNVAAISLVAKAIGPGVYANSFKIGVIAGVSSGFAISITDAASVVLETSSDCATQADAVAWSQNSAYIRLTLGASILVPIIAGANVITLMTGGTDDRLNAVDAQWLNALNLFTKDLGPGNVSAPGRTTDPAHTQLCDHAAANNRVAIMDAPDTPTIATLQTTATNAKSTGSGQYGGLF